MEPITIEDIDLKAAEIIPSVMANQPNGKVAERLRIVARLKIVTERKLAND